MADEPYGARLDRLERIQDKQMDLLASVHASQSRMEEQIVNMSRSWQALVEEMAALERNQDEQIKQRTECLKECSGKINDLDTRYQVRLQAVEPFTKAIKYVTLGISTVLVGATGTWLASKFGPSP